MGWIPEPPPDILDDLTDVDIPTPAQGDMVYRNDSGLWVVVGGTKGDGKVPTVQSDGTVEWETPAGGGGGSSVSWSGYTPTWEASTTNPTLNNGTLTGRYAVIDDLVYFKIHLTIGNTTSAGSGAWLFGLPVNAADVNFVLGSADMLDITTRWWVGSCWKSTGGAYGGKSAAGNFVIHHSNGAEVSHNSPMTPATGDTYSFQGVYEAA